MASYKEPHLDLVLEWDFRLGVSRRHLEEVTLRYHDPRLELVETRGVGPNNVNTFSVRERDTLRPWNLGDLLLSCLADEVAAANIEGLEAIKLPEMNGHMSDTEWSFAVIGNPTRFAIESIYRSSQKRLAAIDDGLKRCVRVTTPRLVYSDQDGWSKAADKLLKLFESSKSSELTCWVNDTCDVGVHFEEVRKDVRQPMGLGVYQNLLALWGIYEKEIERFHRPQRRHPWNQGAISLRFGDGGPADRYPAMRTDTPLGRAAFAREVYATKSITELHNLVHSSLAQGNRKVDIPSSDTQQSPGARVSFREQESTFLWNITSAWCTFAYFMIRYAHWLDYKDFAFFVYGGTSIEDLLELINLPPKYRRTFFTLCKENDLQAVQARQVLPTQGQEIGSQGGPRDKPPDKWIRKELEIFNALGVPNDPSGHNTLGQNNWPVKVPDLIGDIHPLFRKGAWDSRLDGEADWTWTANVDTGQRNSLRQACILASRLLDVATPWFASFVPRANCELIKAGQPPIVILEVTMVEGPSRGTLEEIRRSLHEIAESVKISFSPSLSVFSQRQRALADVVPSQPVTLNPSEHDRRDKIERETLHHKRRTIHISIASELRQAALSAKPGTEEYLFAVFYLAIVLVSEVGYAVWLTNFDNLFFDYVRLGKEVYPLLTTSLIGWIFGGWFPRPIRLDPNDDNLDGYKHVREGLHWNKILQQTMEKPLYYTAYSIPVHYIQKVLNQRRWDDVDRAQDPQTRARRLLKPDTPFQQRHTARATVNQPDAQWDKDVREATYYEDSDWEITPSPEWNLVELRAAGAVGCSVSRPGLTENVHPIFAYENWTRAPENIINMEAGGTQSVTRDVYDRLQPAMMLATLLLKVGAPWFTSLLPQIKFALESPRGAPRKISAVRAYGLGELAAARTGLEMMAGHVRFDSNALQLPDDGQLGLCSRGLRNGPGDPDGNYKYQACDQGWHERLDASEKAKKRPYRRIQISVSSQVIRAILESAPHSERYLQAVYSLATTLTHELAHAALYVNFNWTMGGPDPALRGEAQAELGNSLISWLHRGWILSNNTALDQHGTVTFPHGAAWRKWHRVLEPDEYVPRYWTYYSIPVSYIQRLFVQAEWDKFNLDNTPEKAADALLRPIWPFRNGEYARKAEKTSYDFWSTKGGPDQWYEGDEPAEEDDHVDPYYVDEDWDGEPGPS